ERQSIAHANRVAEEAALVVHVVLGHEGRVVESDLKRRAVREDRLIIVPDSAGADAARLLELVVPLARELAADLQLVVDAEKRPLAQRVGVLADVDGVRQLVVARGLVRDERAARAVVLLLVVVVAHVRQRLARRGMGLDLAAQVALAIRREPLLIVSREVAAVGSRPAGEPDQLLPILLAPGAAEEPETIANHAAAE